MANDASARPALVVGVETLILRRSMTGVGNYLFNIVRALIETKPEFALKGLGYLSWRTLDHDFIEHVLRQHDQMPVDKTVEVPATKSNSVRSLAHQRLANIDFFRRLYHSTRPIQFAVSSRLQSLDLFHAFNYVPPADPGVPVLPVVYDLSFIRMPEAHPQDRLKQMASLEKTVSQAQQVHTISQFTRNEIADVYGYPSEKIFVAPPAASVEFRPLGQEMTEKQIAPFDLSTGNYFMAVGTLEPRKNLRTLISAYSQLAPSTRQRIPLIIVGGVGWGDLALPPATERLISSGQLRFMKNVSNSQLRGLYEGARLMLFPSLYEGFGMPVVEAMACGTPVAHSADTAMDEVSEGQATRIAAMDVVGWTNAMTASCDTQEHTNSEARDQRISQAKLFDWQRSAEIVARAYQDYRASAG